MARAFLERALGDAGIPAQVVARALSSAGSAVAQKAVTAAEAYGASLDGHVPTLLFAEELDGFDLVLVMEKEQRRSLVKRFPHMSDRTYRSREYGTGEPADVKDPVGHDQAEYNDCAKRLHRACQNVAERLSASR